MSDSDLDIAPEKFEKLIIWSERYAMGRTSYVADGIIDIITEHLKDISTGTIKTLIADFRDIRKQQLRFEMYGEAEKQNAKPLVNAWGGRDFEMKWRRLWTRCQNELANRVEKGEQL